MKLAVLLLSLILGVVIAILLVVSGFFETPADPREAYDDCISELNPNSERYLFEFYECEAILNNHH